MSRKESEDSGVPKIVIKHHIDDEYDKYLKQKEGNPNILTPEEFEVVWWQSGFSSESLEEVSSSLSSEEIISEGLLTKSKKELDEYLQRKVRLSEAQSSHSMKRYEETLEKVESSLALGSAAGALLAEEHFRREAAMADQWQRNERERRQADAVRKKISQAYSVGETIFIQTGEYAGYSGTVEDVDIDKGTATVRPDPRENDEWVHSIEISSKK